MERLNHPYIPNSHSEIKQEMMKEIGIVTIDELFSDIPEKFLLKRRLNLPDALSEFELKKHVTTLLSRNVSSQDMAIFLGAGCWNHYVPAVVKEIVHRSEFLTSYTPYQPEISQGMLQALFEYQSMICELTGMQVANCSLYDWASALGEAGRMASRVTGRKEVLFPKIIHPERRTALEVYTAPAKVTLKQISYNNSTGQLNLNDLKKKISEKTAAVYIENPSYLGFLEAQGTKIGEEAHNNGALLIVGVDPTSLGILKPPGEYDADIVIGEAQPLGNSMNFGGPLLGIFACRDDMKLIRQMPGRIIGMTNTVKNDRRGFCLTLQTREQHIRREKATSNICSNESLCALSSAVYLALLGPQGLKKLGEIIMGKTQYAIHCLSENTSLRAPIFKGPHFKEFTINFDQLGLSGKEIHKKLLQQKIHGGKDVSKEFPKFGNTALYCVTETTSKRDIEGLKEAIDDL